MSEVNVKKRPSPGSSEDEPEMSETAIKKALMMNSKEDEELKTKMAELGEILPSLKSKNGVMSDEGLGKLFKALCGETNKMYDSDDSLISESDGWDAETIAEKDRKFREAYKSVSWMKAENDMANDIVNIGKETKEQKEKRRKWMRERQLGLVTEEEKAAEEKKRQKEKRRREKELNNKVQVFDESTKYDLRNITCSFFASFLEALVEIIPDDDDKELQKDYKAQLKKIDKTEFAKRVKLYYGIKRNFFIGKYENAETFILKMIRRIVLDEDIVDVFNSDKYGFHFTFKECIQALENYYSLNKPITDNGESINPLAISIRGLVSSSFHVARSGNPDLQLNDNLKEALFD